MPTIQQERPKEMKIKQKSGSHKAEFKSINSSKGSVAGGGPEKGAGFASGTPFMKAGMTKGMHGKAKGGHPTKRAKEMKGY